MGSLYGWYTRKDVIRHLIHDEPRLTTLAHAVRGNVLWTVQQWDNNSSPFIGCYLLLGPVKGNGNDPYACGYKDMAEFMHPYRYNCPIRYLEMAPETCPQWRAIVRREATKRATKLRVGIVAELEGCKVRAVTIDSLKPLRGYDIDNHVRYRITRKLLSGRTFESVQQYMDETGK